MTRPRTYKTEAVTLRQMSLGEADRILTIYTPDMGKLRVVAKGIRRTKSRLGGHLELLNCVSVSLSQGRNLDVITEAQIIQSFRGFRDDLRLLSRALYVAELVDRFMVDRLPNYEVYLLLLNVLAWLEQAGQSDLLLRHFEMHLLGYSGYKPELRACVECRSTLEPGDHYFSSVVGGVLCPDCRVKSDDALILISLNAMKVLRFLQQDADYTGASELKVSSKLHTEIERLLHAYIRFLVERELKSVEFMSLVSSNAATYSAG